MKKIMICLVIFMIPIFAEKYSFDADRYDKDFLENGYYENCLGGYVLSRSHELHPKGKDDVRACYQKKDGKVKLINYASIFPMPMIEKPRYNDSKLGCFFIENFPYVTFGTNLPEQRMSLDIKTADGRTTHCYTDSVLVDEGEYLYYLGNAYSCDVAVSSPDGCHEQKNGMRMVYPQDFRCKMDEVSGYNENGLKLFARMIEKKLFSKFTSGIDYFVFKAPDMRAILPYKFEDSDARALGDSAAAHAPGMYYYFGATLKDSVSFKKSPFKNLKDALDHCYDWGQQQLR